MSLKMHFRWPRFERLSTVVSFLAAIVTIVVLCSGPVVSFLEGPGQHVLAILADLAPIVGWLALADILLLALWGLFELFLPFGMFASFTALEYVYEHGVRSLSDGLQSAITWSVESVDVAGWILLGFMGFLLVTILVSGFCLFLAETFFTSQRVSTT
jgi:hypothetical protein